MTPAGVARFMASLFPVSTVSNDRLLDVGAGALRGRFMGGIDPLMHLPLEQ